MNIDRMRIAAVRALEALGYSYEGGRWLPKIRAMPLIHLTAEADAMHAVLVRLVQRANALVGSAGSEEKAERAVIAYAIEAYEAKRWPLGKEPGGKG